MQTEFRNELQYQCVIQKRYCNLWNFPPLSRLVFVVYSSNEFLASKSIVISFRFDAVLFSFSFFFLNLIEYNLSFLVEGSCTTIWEKHWQPLLAETWSRVGRMISFRSCCLLFIVIPFYIYDLVYNNTKDIRYFLPLM